MGTSKPPAPATLTITPIGYIRTGMRVKFHTRHQPEGRTDVRNVVELVRGRGFEHTLRDLAGFSHLWLVWWFDRNPTWRPVVMPPRGPAVKRGVFATRSPHRPNPVGITAVPLLGVEKLRLILGDVDLLDGTPILDIKPYISSVDSIPNATHGWLDRIEADQDAPPAYKVELSARASEQLEWLRSRWAIDILPRANEILARDPSIHRTRRIRRVGKDRFEIGCGTWRLRFTVEGMIVRVTEVASGYPERLVFGETSSFVQEQEAHRDFMAVFTRPERPWDVTLVK